MQSSSSPCYDFVAACIPYAAALGPIRTARMVQTLVKRESGPVASLEKLAALRIVDNAMAAPMKRKELIEMIGKIKINSLSPFLFGDCPSVAEFILEHVHFHFHFGLWLSPTRVQLSLEDVIVHELQGKEIPIEKILNIMAVVLKKPLKIFTFKVHANTPDAAVVTERIKQVAVDIVGGRFCVARVISN